jgi:hypothetical protein
MMVLRGALLQNSGLSVGCFELLGVKRVVELGMSAECS